MEPTLNKIISYSVSFYTKRMKLISIFSLLFIISYLILLFVDAPTFDAIAGVFLRTGSIPEISDIHIILIVFGYLFSTFVAADAITNINLIIKSQRTLIDIPKKVMAAISTYAVKMFYLLTIFLLVVFALNLLTFEKEVSTYLYPLAIFILYFFLLFIPIPAIVIDDYDTFEAIEYSFKMFFRNPVMTFLSYFLWTLIGLIILTVLGLILYFILPGLWARALLLLINFVFVLPFLLILQTHMYMEKYPLAH